MRIFYVLILVLNNALGICQEKINDCNRAVETASYTKDLIKEVCIPNGYVIKLIYTDTQRIDIDGDSIGDFIINYGKLNLKDGDTSYVSAYKKTNDSTYVFLKTFNNLYPVFLQSYTDPTSNSTFSRFYECYDNYYPLIDLDMKKGVISLNLRIDAKSGYLLKYQYETKKQNWFLEKYLEWLELPDGTIEYSDKQLPSKSESIDEFSYERYLCPDFENKR